MKNKTLFLGYSIASILLCLASEALAENYYVSNGGDDNATGTSPATAWETIGKVNETDLFPGDTVFFQAGGVWRETLRAEYSGSSNNNIVYTRYGSGSNPAIYGSSKAENWTETGTSNVWQTATSLDNLSDEYYAGRLFIVEDDSVTWGNYQNYNASFSNLENQFDYTVNGSTHYLYSTVDPDNFQAIEVTQLDMCIAVTDNNPLSYAEFNGLDLHYARLAGFDAGYPAIRGATDLVFRNCTIGYIGSRASGYAYGISAWHSNFITEFCLITDCGRRGISINLYLDQAYPENRNLNSIIVRNNVFKRGYHTTALDLSSQQTTHDTMTNIYFYNNIVDDSEHTFVPSDWISNQVFTQEGDSYINNVYIFGNILIHATGREILVEDGDSIYIWQNTIYGHNPNIDFHPYANVALNYPNQVDFRNNILYDDLPDNNIQNHGVLMYDLPSMFLAKDYNLYYSLHPKTDRNFSAHRPDNNLNGDVWYWNTNEWNEYLSDNPNFDQNSPEPADPLFEDDYYDLRLTEGSPAIGAAISIDMVNEDLLGNAMNDPPDLGAIQFNGTPTSSFDNPELESLIISPNPADHHIRLMTPAGFSEDVFSIRIYNVVGKRVYERDVNASHGKSVDIPIAMDNGIYFVEVTNGHLTLTNKFIVIQ